VHPGLFLSEYAHPNLLSTLLALYQLVQYTTLLAIHFWRPTAKLIEHTADIQTIDDAETLFFLVAKPPTDPGDKITFSIVKGKFKSKTEHGTLETNDLGGFMSVGTTQSSKLKKRYLALCSYTNMKCSPMHAAIALSLDNAYYAKNFREALQEEWKSFMSNRSILNVSFKNPTVSVEHDPLASKGWHIMSNPDLMFTEDDVNDTRADDLSKFDYPPRIFLTLKPLENAEYCKLKLSLTGLCKNDVGVSFDVPLNNTDVCTPTRKQSKPNLPTLMQMGVIRDTASKYYEIGTILLHDKYGCRIKSIEGTDREEKIREIYQKWLQEDENHSWATLCDCFRQCHLNSLARSIEQRVGLPSPPSPPGIIH
jgi:hypothetical protein